MRLDFTQAMSRKDRVVGEFVGSVEKLLRAHGVDLFIGEACLRSPRAVQVRAAAGDCLEIECSRLVIATGSRPARPRLDGVNLPGVITSRDLLQIREQPSRLVVIGASVVGMEFASIFHRLGTKVTVLGRRTFLKAVEQRLAARYRALCSRKGLEVWVGLDLQGIESLGDGSLRVRYLQSGEEKCAEGDYVLLATGRDPVTEGLGLRENGIETVDRGWIRVDPTMGTSLPGVYAAGDVTGGMLLAHVASAEGVTAVENALGGARAMDYRVVPNCVFTDPEIASVGMTEDDAKNAGAEFGVARFPLSANGRALTMGTREGQVRIVYERGTGIVLGMHIMGPHASELIGEGAVAVKAGVCVRELAETIHQHPTLSESIMEAAFAGAFGEAIHYHYRQA